MSENIQCVIVDDEKNAHYVLKNYINRSPGLVLTAQYFDAATAIEFLQRVQIDLIFLDINMPGTDGFELIKALQSPPKIILTTAYSDYALKAFDFGVLDYLVKPIPFPRFEQALKRYQEHSGIALAEEGVLGFNNFITLKTDAGMVDFPLREISYIQSWGNYIKLHTVKQTYLCTATTVEVERKLPKSEFIRIHKSYIVAINKIEDFTGDIISIKEPQIDLPAGITYRRILAEALKF
ncbi:DNA-binding LytR/AlgR family response regulator [Pedobacter cryoconitis]|uniref:DNA-binding LytR/AlgR family response regulator n=1 Tax=Pedobacter cryoconitis TaxID=188932 RepID=A0A7W8ZJD4_9SPHI|nr:LytTR family DNA-binding domain-containing protein [Pedobacter cryoconitis]MBB5635097.1 DNA-binding LytR/AlgR family response regulator [Pedobacter cryoconitis]MBB6271719.1 DNA-binding LytR/AlgR family response regulator [Pedobacter cryoconitis]